MGCYKAISATFFLWPQPPPFHLLFRDSFGNHSSTVTEVAIPWSLHFPLAYQPACAPFSLLPARTLGTSSVLFTSSWTFLVPFITVFCGTHWSRYNPVSKIYLLPLHIQIAQHSQKLWQNHGHWCHGNPRIPISGRPLALPIYPSVASQLVFSLMPLHGWSKPTSFLLSIGLLTRRQLSNFLVLPNIK